MRDGDDHLQNIIQAPQFNPPAYGSTRAAHFFRGLNGLVRARGGDCRKILECLEIDPIALEDQDYPLDNASAMSLLEHCGRLLNDSLFGLHLADYQDADVFGCLTTMARAAPTLRVGIETFVKYLPVFHCPDAKLELVTTKDVAEFRWYPWGFGHGEMETSHGLLLAAKFLQAIAGEDFRPDHVISVSDIWHRNLPEMEKRFGCSVFRKASASAIAFSADLLDRPLKTSQPIIFHLLQSYLSHVRHENRSTIVDQVRATVRWAPPPGNWSMDRCAAKLGISARTLEKRLRAIGVQFSEIVEEQRIEAAKHALLRTGYSLTEIATHLGYSEQTSFGRAFKRWTKLTPQMFREEHGIS